MPRSAPRLSPRYGWPSGVTTSHSRRAQTTSASGSIRAKVSGSGRRYMSDSSSRADPSIAEPSNHSPCCRTSGSRRTGMETFLTVPAMSANCSSTWTTPAARQRSITSFSVSGMAQQIVEVRRGARRGQEAGRERGDYQPESLLGWLGDPSLGGEVEAAEVEVLPVLEVVQQLAGVLVALVRVLAQAL